MEPNGVKHEISIRIKELDQFECEMLTVIPRTGDVLIRIWVEYVMRVNSSRLCIPRRYDKQISREECPLAYHDDIAHAELPPRSIQPVAVVEDLDHSLVGFRIVLVAFLIKQK